MLSNEMAELYGLKDAALCKEFVAFLNGMMTLAEANRRECWETLCLGMLNMQTKLKSLQGLHSELEGTQKTTMQRLEEAFGVIERLNATNRDYKAEIETLRSQLSSGPNPLVRGEGGSSGPDPLVRGDGARQQLRIQMGKSNSAPTRIVTAKRSITEITPESENAQPPLAKKDKSEVVIELRNRVAVLLSENERLNRMFSALKVETPAVDTVKRVNNDEGNRLRRVNAELETKFNALTEEAHRQAREHTAELERQAQEHTEAMKEELHRQAQEHTEAMKASNAEWQKERLEWDKQYASRDGLPQILIPSAFSIRGTVMECPVPIRTGRLMPLIDIYHSWIRYPADSEGTFFSSFICPYTAHLTSLAPASELILLQSIAAELRLYVVPPLRFQYWLNGNWVDFAIFDQISIAAMCCKHYRLGTARATENVMVCHGDYICKIHITDNAVDFQMHPMHNPTNSSPVCLDDSVCFFQRWTFPAGGDGSAADQ